MSRLKLKYTSIDIEVEDADGKDYFGYIAVQFNYATEIEKFFMDSYEGSILYSVTELMNKSAGGYEKDDIAIQDTALLINLKSVAHKALAPDIAQIVKGFEKVFDEKVG